MVDNIQKIKSHDVRYRDLGLAAYQPTWDYQTTLLKELVERKTNNRHLPVEEQTRQAHYFLVCEHPHVYTLGRNGSESNLLVDADELARLEATYVKINRGGDITYHGFGQLVGYPILDLDEFFTDIARYIRSIEEMIIRVLADYGLVGERIDGASGVWIEATTPRARKICAVGVHLSRWVTMHGFAFNINTDLSYFKHIVPCGIDDKGVTSLAAELGRAVDMDEVKAKVKHYFQEVFGAVYID